VSIASVSERNATLRPLSSASSQKMPQAPAEAIRPPHDQRVAGAEAF
jgi:hypothetical protein